MATTMPPYPAAQANPTPNPTYAAQPPAVNAGPGSKGGTKSTKPPATGSTTKLSSLEAQAEALAQAGLQPQMNAIQQEQSYADAQARAQQAAMTGFYSALAPYIAGIQGETSNAYNSAAQAIGDVGKGYAGVLGQGAQANADATKAALTRAGQTQAIPYATGKANPGAALTDAFDASHGGIAATSFAEQGAAHAAAAANLPNIWAAQGRDQMLTAQQKQLANDSQFQAKLMDLAAQLPGEVTKNYQALQQLALDNKKFALDLQKAKTDRQYKAFQEKLAVGKYNLDVQKTGFTEKLDVAKQALAANKFAYQQFQDNRQYQVSLARLGVSEKNLQLRILQNSFKMAHGGLSQKDIGKYTKLATGLANQYYTGTTTTYKDGTTQSHGQLTYNQALGKMLQRNVPVQVALAALDRVYPAQYRPSPDALAKFLGPLAPDQLKAQANRMDNPYQAPPGTVPNTRQGQYNMSTGAGQPQSYALSQLPKYGWHDKANAQALDMLWTRESGWSVTAKNSSSGALGIPQALGHTLPPGYAGNYRVQIDWGLNYIKGRYGSPTAAWAHELQYGWY